MIIFNSICLLILVVGLLAVQYCGRRNVALCKEPDAVKVSLQLNPGVGQNTAMHALSATRIFFLRFCPVLFIVIFFQILPRLSLS